MKKNPWLRKTGLAVGAAFAMFLLLLAVTAAAVGFVSARRSGGAEDAVTDWKFFWADQKKTPEADGDAIWKIANVRHPVQKSLNELFAARYIRLQTALPASAGPQTLKLATGNHLLRVCLDGREVWNNGCNEGTALYVGNRVNTVSIPVSAEETTVDSYLRVPLSFSLEARLVSAGRLITGDSLISQLGLVGSLSLLAVSLLTTAVLFCILIRQSIDRDIRQAEWKAQMEKDARWVNETITGCAGVFTQETLTGFCSEAVQTVRSLILFDREDRSGSRPLRIGAAVRSDAGWEEFFRENLTEDCCYDTIVRRAAAYPGGGVFPGRHSVDMTFCNAEDPLCVIHVEGVGNGLSPDLDNVLRIAHQCITMALDNLTLKKDLAQTQENVFLTLAEIVEQKSAGTGRHLRDVAEMVAILAGELGISLHEARILSSASMMHDIGKLAIPESIVSKQGQLTDDEYAIMQDHVIYGYNMLSKSPGDFMKAAAVIAQQHHEKYDGTGYLELKGEQIHLYARIVALADVLDALLSKRPYKDAWTPESAFEYIDGESGRHFDPRVVQAFDRCRDRLLAVKRQTR